MWQMYCNTTNILTGLKYSIILPGLSLINQSYIQDSSSQIISFEKKKKKQKKNNNNKQGQTNRSTIPIVLLVTGFSNSDSGNQQLMRYGEYMDIHVITSDPSIFSSIFVVMCLLHHRQCISNYFCVWNGAGVTK